MESRRYSNFGFLSGQSGSMVFSVCPDRPHLSRQRTCWAYRHTLAAEFTVEVFLEWRADLCFHPSVAKIDCSDPLDFVAYPHALAAHDAFFHIPRDKGVVV